MDPEWRRDMTVPGFATCEDEAIRYQLRPMIRVRIDADRKPFRVDLERSLSSSLVRTGPPQSAYRRGALACRANEGADPL